jgi:hypothetical protein
MVEFCDVLREMSGAATFNANVCMRVECPRQWDSYSCGPHAITCLHFLVEEYLRYGSLPTHKRE